MLTVVARKVQVRDMDEDEIEFEYWVEFLGYMQKRLESSTSQLLSSANVVSLIDQKCTSRSIWYHILFTLTLDFDYSGMKLSDLTSDDIESLMSKLNWHFSGDVDQDKITCAWETTWEIYESEQDSSPKYKFAFKETSLSFWGDNGYF